MKLNFLCRLHLIKLVTSTAKKTMFNDLYIRKNLYAIPRKISTDPTQPWEKLFYHISFFFYDLTLAKVDSPFLGEKISYPF